MGDNRERISRSIQQLAIQVIWRFHKYGTGQPPLSNFSEEKSDADADADAAQMVILHLLQLTPDWEQLEHQQQKVQKAPIH